ncbi:hypothetical protein [Vibrio sp. 99-70-13A1]|uniref:hypothetical protein n=1 Tax=Vibrio sp. 99-70-13A1 TaxID=2607601 RepID=UPI001493D887|nr:hypothetical protein [Vibrio sp. 99-70-13A1]NOH96058.1 hypothetical protein [Vibrio sp. 99-70-13A1]
MELEQCWMYYLKAEQLMEQGHWPEAQRLYHDVLSHLPNHIQEAAFESNIKPCQFACLLAGLRDASVAQSELLNRLGQQQQAFDTLNQSYALLQFISLENTSLIQRTHLLLEKQSEDLLNHLIAFCSAQRSSHWMLELEQIQRAHHHFGQLKSTPETHSSPNVLN